MDGQNTPQAVAPKKSSGSKIPLIILVLLLIGATAGMYFWQQQQVVSKEKELAGAKTPLDEASAKS